MPGLPRIVGMPGECWLKQAFIVGSSSGRYKSGP